MNQPPDHTAYTQQYFTDMIGWYDWAVAPLRPLRRKLVKLAGAKRGAKVLDVACGTGEQSIAFAKAGCSVQGVDLTEAMLARARWKVRAGMNIDFSQADATALPYPDESFDISTISLALHDMPREMAMQVLTEMKRVTRSSGVIAIVEHHHANNLFGWMLHRRLLKNDTRYYPAFVEAGLQSYLDEAELHAEKHITWLLGMFQVAICKVAK